MVKQRQTVKTSSTKRPSEYEFTCFIAFGATLPAITETKLDSTGEPGYTISGILDENTSRAADWREPPHVAFANLRVEDPKSVEAYMRQYGVFCSEADIDRERETFEVHAVKLRKAQEVLREAWHGRLPDDFEAEDDMKAEVIISANFIPLYTKSLWTLITFLFMRDSVEGSLGVCENPSCPAPYFRKKRKTQKFCEAGCVAYAQRQYALRWWNTEGKKRREKKTKGKTKRKQ